MEYIKELVCGISEYISSKIKNIVSYVKPNNNVIEDPQNNNVIEDTQNNNVIENTQNNNVEISNLSLLFEEVAKINVKIAKTKNIKQIIKYLKDEIDYENKLSEFCYDDPPTPQQKVDQIVKLTIYRDLIKQLSTFL